MQTILAKTVANRAIWVEARKQQQPLASFQNKVVPTQRNFYDALAGTHTAFILGCKKAPPSKGLVHEDFDLAAVASVYKHYASTISVLCDKKYFQDSLDLLPIVSKVASQPILCKGFTIDPYRIYLAHYYQADACLLILSVLDDEQYRQLSAVACSLNVGVLIEVGNEEGLERAIALEAKMMGINNRDLHDMSIDLNRTRQLAARLGPGVTVINGFGIHTYAEVCELSHLASGFLIGSALMEQADLEATVKHVLLGENKVCGLTCPQDARVAWESGVIYGGLIFVPASSWAVNDAQVKTVIATTPLQYIGVSRNAPLNKTVARAQALGLAAVQLHGDEDQAYIDALRDALAGNVRIWKALSAGETLPVRTFRHVNKYLSDSGQGGGGQRFDWSLLQDQDLRDVVLAGGLDADNCVEATKSGCAGLDFNSGVKSQPGTKDTSKLASILQTLHAY